MHSDRPAKRELCRSLPRWECSSRGVEAHGWKCTRGPCCHARHSSYNSEASFSHSPICVLVPLALVAYGWAFWLVGNLFDVAWRVICSLGEPIAWVRRKARGLAYGPSPRRLATILEGRPLLLVTTQNDEADRYLRNPSRSDDAATTVRGADRNWKSPTANAAERHLYSLS